MEEEEVRREKECVIVDEEITEGKLMTYLNNEFRMISWNEKFKFFKERKEN